METDPSSPESPGGPLKTRSWWGVKLVGLLTWVIQTGADVQKAARRLLEAQNAAESVVPAAMTTNEKQLRGLDELATERLLAAGGAGMGVRRKVMGGEGGSGPVR